MRTIRSPGIALRFSCEVLDVRAASDEEDRSTVTRTATHSITSTTTDDDGNAPALSARGLR